MSPVLRDPPSAPPRAPSTFSVRFEPRRPLGPAPFTYVYRIGSGITAFLTAAVILTVIGFSSDWRLTTGYLVLEGLIISVVVLASELLLSAAYRGYHDSVARQTQKEAVEALIRTVEQQQEHPGQSSHEAFLDTRSGQVRKRALDLALALGLLLLMAPLLVLTALLVRIDSPGPVFLRYRRVGANGRIFVMYKFRTMYADASASQVGGLEAQPSLWKLSADPRVTRVGAFLRRASLDELPQLFNVLRGDMSIVGPPASIPAKHAVPLDVPPGIIGPWKFVDTNYAGAETLEELKDHYRRSWSVRLDIRLLLQSIVSAFRA